MTGSAAAGSQAASSLAGARLPERILRRACLRRLLAGGAWLSTGMARAGAAEPFRRSGAARLKVSLAAFSFRRYFRDFNRGDRPRRRAAIEKPIDLFGFIDYCAEQGCNAAELTSYYFPKEADADYMRRIRRHAFLRGVEISGSSVGNDFTLVDAGAWRGQIDTVKRWIDLCAWMGAPHLRVFAGDAAGGSETEARARCIAALEEVCEYAGGKGIFIGLENHHGIVATPEGMSTILRAVRSDWFGANLDTGNFVTEDPYADLARIAPYAINVQLKVAIRRAGAAADEETDLKRITEILTGSGYQGFVTLEYQNQRPWEEVPLWLERMRTAFSG